MSSRKYFPNFSKKKCVNGIQGCGLSKISFWDIKYTGKESVKLLPQSAFFPLDYMRVNVHCTTIFVVFVFIKDVIDKPIDEDSNLDAAGYTSITQTTQAVTQMVPRNGEQTVKG